MIRLEDHHRERGSGPHDGERCACKIHRNQREWETMCVAARAAFEELHAIAAEDHALNRRGI